VTGDSWLGRLRQGLARSSRQLAHGIATIVGQRRLGPEALQELEELLITSDLGVATSGRLIEDLRRRSFDKEVNEEEVRRALAEAITQILVPVARPLSPKTTARPYVVLMVGVNGSGKTTTLGKLASFFRKAGLKVLLAAGDTFRAAAIDQLKVWAERAEVPIVTAVPGADAAGLAYEALERARAGSYDLLLIDTAGRLHNRADLMAELQKMTRVLKKLDPEAPHATVLVLDATTGQNALRQVETFRTLVQVTGLILTKLDGSAKGGVLIALAEQQGLPVHAIGIGEGLEDLRPFDPGDFARGLLGLDAGA